MEPEYDWRGGQEPHPVHDLHNKVRLLIDAIELAAIAVLMVWGLARMRRFDEPDWFMENVSIFSSWHEFWHFASGLFLLFAGLLLVRDWGHGYKERREERIHREFLKKSAKSEAEVLMIDSAP